MYWQSTIVQLRVWSVQRAWFVQPVQWTVDYLRRAFYNTNYRKHFWSFWSSRIITLLWTHRENIVRSSWNAHLQHGCRHPAFVYIDNVLINMQPRQQLLSDPLYIQYVTSFFDIYVSIFSVRLTQWMLYHVWYWCSMASLFRTRKIGYL